MNWLNIELTTLRSEEYLGSDPVQRATWLNLLAYCADQENGGVIKSCGEWGSRKWLQLLGVTKEETQIASDLWHWCGKSLHVWNYPKSKEIEVRRKRELGKKGGRPKKVNDTSADKPDGSRADNLEVPKCENGKERKGKEEEGNKKKAFVAPTIDEVKTRIVDYAKSKDLLVDNMYVGITAETFVNHYENCGWRLNSGKGTLMKKWELALYKWMTTDFTSGKIARAN